MTFLPSTLMPWWFFMCFFFAHCKPKIVFYFILGLREKWRTFTVSSQSSTAHSAQVESCFYTMTLSVPPLFRRLGATHYTHPSILPLHLTPTRWSEIGHTLHTGQWHGSTQKSEISVSNPVLPEPEKTRKPGFRQIFKNPKPGFFSSKNPGFQKEAKNRPK